MLFFSEKLISWLIISLKIWQILYLFIAYLFALKQLKATKYSQNIIFKSRLGESFTVIRFLWITSVQVVQTPFLTINFFISYSYIRLVLVSIACLLHSMKQAPMQLL